MLALCLKADIVFMGLHGSNGEDGKIQAVFELMGIKYTGTDYISSAISMSKELTKKVLVQMVFLCLREWHLRRDIR